MRAPILIYTPTGQDAALSVKVLAQAAIESVVCASAVELAQQLDCGAGAVLTVEEALPSGAFEVLRRYVAQQPDWSDLAIILLTRHGQDAPAVRHAVTSLGNLTLLERPVRSLTLLTCLHAALRARARQYRMREAERHKDEFIASLGHELRNPLAPIKTSMALLAHLYPDAAPVTRIKDVVERQVTHLTRLVDDLLDVARITNGNIALRRQDIFLSAIVEHVNDLCLQAARAKHIDLRFDLPRPDVTLHVDHARMVQILSNVISNAVKFTPAGGRIKVSAELADEQLIIRVEDNGIGIEPEAIPRIFSMFEQGKSAAGHLASGLGIGLSLARQFIELHGGSIDAYSAGTGAGSLFVIRLPLAGATPEAVRPAQPSLNAPVKRAQILVVDDNFDAADSLQALLQLEGCDASTAYDGYAAVVAAANMTLDLIVMDLGMPGMDGYQAARLIRQLPNTRHTMLIALTGWGQEQARYSTAQAGFDHHLTKPVEVRDLIALLAGKAP